MRMRSPSLALAVALWLGACTRGETAIPDVDASPSHYELPNGLDVVLIVDRRMPMVAIDLAYHVGSMHDGRAKGLAHLVEHLMFRGTITTPDGEMSNLLIEAGAV